MRNYVLRFEPLPNQNVSGTFEIIEPHGNYNMAYASSIIHLERLNGTKVRDKFNRTKASVQWQLASIELEGEK